MANKFEKKEWEDRQSQYPSRRRLTPTNIENVYEVERAEGDVTEPGNAFDANNMNDMENRIYDAFSKLDGTDITVLDKNNVFSKTLLEDVLFELFTYASNGKTLIANAIGGSASAKFKELADLAGSIKTDRDNGKTLIANAIGETRNGTASASESFSYLADRIILDKMSFWTGKTSGGTTITMFSNSTQNITIPVNFPFIPSFLIAENLLYEFITSESFFNARFSITNKKTEQISAIIDMNISSITSSSIIITVKTGNLESFDIPNGKIYIAYSELNLYAFR